MLPTAWTSAHSCDQQGISNPQAQLLATALHLLDTCWVPSSELDAAGTKIDQTWSQLQGLPGLVKKTDKLSKDP